MPVACRNHMNVKPDSIMDTMEYSGERSSAIDQVLEIYFKGIYEGSIGVNKMITHVAE